MPIVEAREDLCQRKVVLPWLPMDKDGREHFSSVCLCLPLPVLAFACAHLCLCLPLPVLAFACARLCLCSPLPVLAFACARLCLCSPLPVLAFACACLFFLFLFHRQFLLMHVMGVDTGHKLQCVHAAI